MLRVVNLMEHEFMGDGCLCTMYVSSTTLKRRNHLLHHLIKEDMGKLGVEKGTKLERDLRMQKEEMVKLVKLYSVVT